MASIAVKDTGTALVATNVKTYQTETVELQLINIADGTTPDSQLAISSSGAAKVQEELPDSLLSPAVVGVANSATLISAASSTRRKITIQNFTEAASNPVVYVGGLTVSTSTGIALLDGNSRTFETTAAIYGIVVTGTVNVRLLVEFKA